MFCYCPGSVGIVSTLYQSQHPTFAPVHCARIASALRGFTQKSHALNACGKEGYDADALSGKPPIARQHRGAAKDRGRTLHGIDRGPERGQLVGKVADRDTVMPGPRDPQRCVDLRKRRDAGSRSIDERCRQLVLSSVISSLLSSPSLSSLLSPCEVFTRLGLL